MEHFVIIVNGFQPLTITIKGFILDVAAALDPLLSVTYTFYLFRAVEGLVKTET